MSRAGITHLMSSETVSQDEDILGAPNLLTLYYNVTSYRVHAREVLNCVTKNTLQITS